MRARTTTSEIQVRCWIVGKPNAESHECARARYAPSRRAGERIRVIVEHGADFVHVGNAIVVFGTESEPREGVEYGDADRVRVPSTEDRKKREWDDATW